MNSASSLIDELPPRAQRRLLHGILRSDLNAFAEQCFSTVNPGYDFHPNWHLEAMAHVCTRVLRGDIRRAIITLPPRYLKSTIVSVSLPAYALGLDPTRRII